MKKVDIQSIQVSTYPKKTDIHVSKYPHIHVSMISKYPLIQVSKKNQYPRYPSIRISEKSGIHSSLAPCKIAQPIQPIWQLKGLNFICSNAMEISTFYTFFNQPK